MDPFIWDACALPLRNSCVDVVTTDLVSGSSLRKLFTKSPVHVQYYCDYCV